MKVGIVAVHGVIPQIRYGFQDDVASNLCVALNAKKNGPVWTMTVVPSRTPPDGAADVPTISRVHVEGDDPNQPAQDCFDVHEAYWSPIDKGKTSFVSVLVWLFRTVFLPLNDFARYEERPLKIFWDLGFVGLAILVCLALLLLAALLSAAAIRDVLSAVCANGGSLPANVPLVHCYNGVQPHMSVTGAVARLFERSTWREILDFPNLFAMLGLLLSPITFVKALQPIVVVGLACGLAGGILLWQAVSGVIFLIRKSGEFARRDPIQIVSRIIAIVVLAALAYAFLHVEWTTPENGSGWLLAQSGLWLIFAVACFSIGRSFLAWFVTNFFGDVQIYTTRNQNSEFYALREAILERVTGVMLGVLTAGPGGTPYDRVYVLAHSLGSTIAMDALLRLYNAQKAGDAGQHALSSADWRRIRAFVTFGTALEKTKYFFNVWNATPSQEWEQWNGAVYGTVFTADRATLRGADNSAGIFWLNPWYFSDFVSDGITTYRSFLRPGDSISKNAEAIAELKRKASKHEVFIGRLLAMNRSRFGPWPRHFETHSHYLEDPWFWHSSGPSDVGVLDVLTAGAGGGTPQTPARAVAIPRWQAFRYRTCEVVK